MKIKSYTKLGIVVTTVAFILAGLGYKFRKVTK